MPTLLVVHHTTSPALHSLYEAGMAGATDDRIEGVTGIATPAWTAAAVDVLVADAYVVGTPANLGYMSGALKPFFDQIYYPCLDASARRPYGLYVHGNSDTGGTVRGIETIVTGLKWQAAQAHVLVTGEPGREDLD